MLLPTIKKLAVIITIAILFSVFAFSTVELINERPDYGDYCKDNGRYPVAKMDVERCPEIDIPPAEQNACSEVGGNMQPIFVDGCVSSYECNTCQVGYDEADKMHRLFGFIITSVLGLIAVIVGLYVVSKDEILQWVFSGFMIGGIISIFVGTITYFGDMNRLVRPLVMLAEIALIIFVAIKTSKRNATVSTKTKKK